MNKAKETEHIIKALFALLNDVQAEQKYLERLQDNETINKESEYHKNAMAQLRFADWLLDRFEQNTKGI